MQARAALRDLGTNCIAADNMQGTTPIGGPATASQVSHIASVHMPTLHLRVAPQAGVELQQLGSIHTVHPESRLDMAFNHLSVTH